MNWNAQLFNYCERGTDPSFWAEPLNALSNGAFIAAAVFAAVHLAKEVRLAKDERRASQSEVRSVAETSAQTVNHTVGHTAPQPTFMWGLTGLVALIGLGSFGFHTLATRLAQLGDIVPIGVFMLAYMSFALRRFLGLSWRAVALGVLGFVGACILAASIKCGGGGDKPCLNGSLAYLPALLGLLGIGVLVLCQPKGLNAPKNREIGALLLTSAAVFAASLGLRTIDISMCGGWQIFGHIMGTHFLWHLLNGAMLYLLLRAALTAPAATIKAGTT